MRRLLLLLVIPYLLVSCDKKDLEEVEITPAVTWETHKEFMHNFRYIANLHGADDKLFALGLKNFSTISFAEKGEKVEHAYHFFSNMANYKFPLNAKVFVEASGQLLQFRLSENSLGQATHLNINMKEVDPHFRSFHFQMSNKNEAMALSDNNVALVPYYAYDTQTGEHLGPKLLLVKLALDKGVFQERITLNEIKVLDIHNNGHYFHHIKSFDNYFYLHTVDGLARISEEGEVQYVMSNPHMYNIFKHKGNLYTVAFNDRLTSLYKSVNGSNWAHTADLIDGLRDLSFYSVSDDILLAVYNSHLFELNLDTMAFKELDNTGLEGHYITAIKQLKDHIFVGTQSGLFKKNIEHLLTYKETDK
jgi:hypothetical protein